MQANDAKNENPYVAVVAKKYRNLKKKLDKILKIEEKKASGKTLQAEELDLLGAKGSVERSIGDIKAIKEQLEDVSKLFEAVSISTQQQQPREEETQQSVEDNKAEQVTASTQCEVEEKATAEVPDVTSPPPPLVLNFDVEINKLLKALHVYQRYKDVTARPLPDNVDYFGKTLLGQTSISAFPDTLSSSCRVANLYLNEENTEILRGVTYAQMSLYIDQLADEMERCHVRGTTAGLTALLRNTISPAFNSSPSAPSPAFMESEFNGFSTGINLLNSEYNSFNHIYYPAAAVGPAPVAVAPVPVTAPALEVAAPTIPPAPEMVPVEPATTTAVEESPAVAAEEVSGKKTRGPRTRRGRGEDGEKRERRRERKPREETKVTEDSSSLSPAAPTPSVATTPAPASSPVAAVSELPSPPALAPVTTEEPQTTTIPAVKPRRERKPREKPVRAAPAAQSTPAVEASVVTSSPVPASATSADTAPVVEVAAPTSTEKPVKEERKREKKREREPKHKEEKPIETAHAPPAAEAQSAPAVPPAPVVEQAPSAAPAPAPVPAPRKPISYAAAVEPAIAPKPLSANKPAEVGENSEKTRKEFRGERRSRNDLGGDRSSDRSPREERPRRGRGEGGNDREQAKDGAERSERKSPRAVREARGDKQAVNGGNARRAAPSARPSNK